jgi:hypothetical protein
VDTSPIRDSDDHTPHFHEAHAGCCRRSGLRLRPGIIYRSLRPYSTEAFERISEREFTYPQPRWIAGRGFLFLFTKYTKGRELYYSTSPDGRQWTHEDRQ